MTSQRRQVSAHLARHWRNHTVETLRLVRLGLLPVADVQPSEPVAPASTDAQPQPTPTWPPIKAAFCSAPRAASTPSTVRRVK
jgi:hypothetical protein